MEHSFQAGIPSAFTAEFDLGIFHHPQHLLLQTAEGWRTYSLLNHARKTVVGVVEYCIHGIEAKSPYRSPYGSFIFSEHVTEKLLTEFVRFTEGKLREEAVQHISLKNPPEVYAPKQLVLLEKVLLTSGYSINAEETSAVIPIRDCPFTETLHRSKKARLKKCHQQQFSVEMLPLEKLHEVYSFIKTCRAEKGYILSMSLEELQRVAHTFPTVFFLHLVKDANQIVAASISIQVNSKVLYTFYYDHAGRYDPFSPVVFLCEGLFQFCQRHQLEMLDLGTANVNNKPNLPLLNFKLSLGAKPSRKLTFVKNL